MIGNEKKSRGEWVANEERPKWTPLARLQLCYIGFLPCKPSGEKSEIYIFFHSSTFNVKWSSMAEWSCFQMPYECVASPLTALRSPSYVTNMIWSKLRKYTSMQFCDQMQTARWEYSIMPSVAGKRTKVTGAFSDDPLVCSCVHLL